MSDLLERARRARRDSRSIRAASLMRAASAHDRAAAIARNIALALPEVASGYIDCLERAREHETSAHMLRRRARWLTNLRLSDVEINVHLGFPDASCRDAVLDLLHELGPWEGGELIDLPDQGVYFRIASDDPVISGIAVRERLRSALVSLGRWEQLVTIHAVWPERL